MANYSREYPLAPSKNNYIAWHLLSIAVYNYFTKFCLLFNPLTFKILHSIIANNTCVVFDIIIAYN